jgi:protein gp37
MSDLFHESVSFDFIFKVFCRIAQCRETTFQIPTKRPERALEFYAWLKPAFILENLWLGVSCENQEQADKRIPLLLQIPAAVRFLSCEPLIGPITLPTAYCQLPIGSTWVIAGGESGHMARPMHPDWVRSLRDQCATANVPFFFKQWGEWKPTTYGGDGKAEYQWAEHGQSWQWMCKVGKSKSGNLLDGRTHLEFPTTGNRQLATGNHSQPATRNS